MKRAWMAWVSLLDRREDPIALVWVRILVAAVVLFDLLYARSLGLVDAIWAPPPEGVGYGAIWGDRPPFVVRWLGAGADTARTVWTVATVSAVLVLIGCATRASAIVLVLALAQLAHLAPDSDRGIDVFLRLVLLILALSGSHARWSIDAWFRHRIGRPMPTLVPAWPRYLLLLQLCWVYFSAGHNKSDGAWGPMEGFSALASVLCDPHFARFDPGWVAGAYPLLQLGTLATMMFELSSPFVPIWIYYAMSRERPGRVRRLCNRMRLRWIWIAAGLTFHLGIAATMRLGIFPFGMLAVYPVLFQPDEFAAAAGRVTGWLRQRRPYPGG